MSTLKFDTWQDSSGTNEFYKCRAWVNFNGTGTVAIRASGNVDSITDNGVGDYDVNFTNAMPDANYSAVMGYQVAAAGTAGRIITYTTTSLNLVTDNGSTAADANPVSVAIFR